jgi:hypothetical protein
VGREIQNRILLTGVMLLYLDSLNNKLANVDVIAVKPEFEIRDAVLVQVNRCEVHRRI